MAEAVRAAAAFAVDRVAVALARATTLRDAAEADRLERDRAAVGAARGAHRRVQDELRDLTDTAHRDEMARARQVARIEQLQARAVEELGIDPDVLVEEFGPHREVPHVAGPEEDPDAAPEPVAYVREEQEKRLRRAERGLQALGRVNPLALEEFAALEERHTFLTTQLEDLKRSKRDLLDIVKEIDERVEQVFTEAFHDTEEQFERVFERLFPGGEGRLVLTDPDNMLTTGIEVEARPPGKKVKRLSLLSGGERSLVAVALLVAIFKARPSPFYIMDEVEAALDDTNLGRLITLFEELRDSSQLIVITHQKRTMEVADALYGVSMRGDGVTTVVSQRIRDVAATAWRPCASVGSGPMSPSGQNRSTTGPTTRSSGTNRAHSGPLGRATAADDRVGGLRAVVAEDEEVVARHRDLGEAARRPRRASSSRGVPGVKGRSSWTYGSSSGSPSTVTRPSAVQQATRSPGSPMTRLTV